MELTAYETAQIMAALHKAALPHQLVWFIYKSPITTAPYGLANHQGKPLGFVYSNEQDSTFKQPDEIKWMFTYWCENLMFSQTKNATSAINALVDLLTTIKSTHGQLLDMETLTEPTTTEV